MTARIRKLRLSKYAREVAPIAERCGYHLGRYDGKHYIFVREGFENFVIPATPSDSRAFANDVARLKRRHPEHFARAKSPNPPSKDQRRRRAQGRRHRRTVSLVAPVVDARTNGNATPIETEPNPGSDEAQALGCSCPVFENNRGEGIEGQPGVFVYLVGCAVHHHEHAPAEPEVRRCPCGNKLPQRKRGRPRKYCFTCRPSEWDRMTREQREYRTARVMRWQQQSKEAA